MPRPYNTTLITQVTIMYHLVFTIYANAFFQMFLNSDITPVALLILLLFPWCSSYSYVNKLCHVFSFDVFQLYMYLLFDAFLPC